MKIDDYIIVEVKDFNGKSTFYISLKRGKFWSRIRNWWSFDYFDLFSFRTKEGAVSYLKSKFDKERIEHDV